MKTMLHSLYLAALCVVAMLAATVARAVDFHVATAQDLQNALTTAANNGANNNIWLTNGYYIGNFNYNSSGGYNLTVTNEPGVTNTQITLDGAGGGRALSITSSGTSGIAVAGITFSRNCGSGNIGALMVAGGSGSAILINSCQFLSPTNTSGAGLELASGLNATVINCTAIGTPGLGGGGLFSYGVTGNVTVQNCDLATNYWNNNPYPVGGIVVYGASVVTLNTNVFNGNSGVHQGGGVYINNTALIALSGNYFIANSPGGVFCYNDTTITLSGNTFTGNTGDSGANCSGTTITLSGNNFSGNLTSDGNAGGATCSGTTITLSGNNFAGNFGSSPQGSYSGGAYCSAPLGNATVSLTDNTFTGNSATFTSTYYGYVGSGGAECVGTVMLTNNTFTGNSAGGYGGGLYCSGTVTLSGNELIQNSAATGGGLCASGQTLILQDNLIVKNSQTSGSSQGGGIWVDASSNLFLINNTITGNTAAGSGGGAAFEVTGTVELLNVFNNIIWGNLANGNGADVWLAGTGQKKIFDFNDVNNMYGVWDIAVNNTNVSPIFFNPVGGDYHLQNTSPCRNIGTNGAPGQPLTDLDGNVRTNSVGQIDLGCYEFNISATHPADTNASFVITPGEFAAYAAAWKAGQPWTNAPASAPNPIPIPANYVTRAGYLMTNGGAYTNDGSARPTNWKLAP